MMFGLRLRFDYFQCAACGCLQICKIPADLRQYYPSAYYSFKSQGFPGNRILGLLKRTRDDYAVFGKSFAGKLLYGFRPNVALHSLARVKLSKSSRILDVGCGAGDLLRELDCLGFHDLTGIDAYIGNDIVIGNDVRIAKGELGDIKRVYDLIMFHHSFEHMEDPKSVLARVRTILAPGGCCVIRIPVVDSYAWSRYGVDWVQIDAPRHLFLHSSRSMGILASGAGLRIRETFYDSTAFQFWGSEQYKRDIALTDDTSYLRNPDLSIFSGSAIRAMERQAKKLNDEKRGDQAAFYLVGAD